MLVVELVLDPDDGRDRGVATLRGAVGAPIAGIGDVDARRRCDSASSADPWGRSIRRRSYCRCDGELLERLAGPGARFREHQREAITDLVEDRARVLCVQRTGWGKSAVYFIATSLLREQGAGPTLIVSPLLALMRNQIAAAERLGIRAHTINSTNRDAWAEVQDAARARRRRPAADQPRAAQQPAVPARACCRCSPSGSGCW